MFGWNESAWFAIFTGAALKGTVVLGAAWIAALVLRRRSAAIRHLVWTAAAAALLALPFLSVGLPAWRVPGRNLLPANTGLVFTVSGIAAQPAAVPESAPAATAVGGRPTASAPDIRFWILLVWAAGAGLTVLRMAFAYGALRRMRRGARPFRAALPEGAAAAPVLEGKAGSMPMTFGLRRPAILLPPEAAGWDDERLRMVLLHESAHVARGDMATQLLARTALALHWWNPLAWFAWREFLKERERAADDLVLASGARASDYAAHLLDVARSMQSAPVFASAGVAMARRSQMEGRLLAILDTKLERKAAGRAAPAFAALVAVIVVAPFAALLAQDTAVPPDVDATIRTANAQKNHEILENAANAYEKLRQYEVAQRLLESALAIRGQVSGLRSAQYAAGLVKLGDIAARQNKTAEAEAYYQKALALGDSAETASALVHMGLQAEHRGDHEAAVDFFQRAVSADPRGPQAGPALTWMAVARERQGMPHEAAALYQQALAVEAPDSVNAAATMELYARLLRQLDRTAEADTMSNAAREIRVKRIAEITRPEAQVSSAQSFRVGGGISAPMLLLKVEPAYTEEARAAKYQGTVLLSVEIGPDGRAHDIQVKRALGMGLDEKAVEALMQWRFKPGTKDGNPVTVQATIEVNFRLM